MPQYNLITISPHYPQRFTPLRDLVLTTAQLLIQRGAAIRDLQYWGRRNLPQVMKSKNTGDRFDIGDYWTLTFDANPPTLQTVVNRLRADPRVLRTTPLRLATHSKSLLSSHPDPSSSISTTPLPSPIFSRGSIEDAFRKGNRLNGLKDCGDASRLATGQGLMGGGGGRGGGNELGLPEFGSGDRSSPRGGGSNWAGSSGGGGIGVSKLGLRLGGNRNTNPSSSPSSSTPENDPFGTFRSNITAGSPPSSSPSLSSSSQASRRPKALLRDADEQDADSADPWLVDNNRRGDSSSSRMGPGQQSRPTGPGQQQQPRKFSTPWGRRGVASSAHVDDWSLREGR